ncbi:hypothetical protein FRC03_003046 [Tulasnella sp. 419]|nr:hypothetical protein FRC02_004289 [Tulasnella sp. 418]KAG8963391.1 hypothetical protein FRC03_003046 [Tulasnella sp. 419]
MAYDSLKGPKFNAVLEALSSWLRDIAHQEPVLNLGNEERRKAQLHDEISALASVDSMIQKEISIRRQQLNLLTAINTLPNEILSIIFRLAWTNDDRMEVTYHSIELVCIRWFTIIRGTPQLFDQMGLRWNARVIADAGRNVPLDIMCTSFNKRFFDLIEPSVHQWRSFEAHGPMLEELRAGCFHQPAPLLKSFHMKTLGFRTPYSIVQAAQDLFAGQAPNLVDLRLDGVFLPWDSGLLRGLRVLHIMVSDGTQVASTAKICQVITACHTLCNLRLAGVAMAYFPDVAMETVSVQLPLLRYLELIDLPRNTFRGILLSITASSLQSLNIEGTFSGERDVTLAFEDLPEDSLLPRFLSTMRAANITKNPWGSHFIRIAAAGDNPSRKFMWRVQVNSHWNMEPLPNTFRYFLKLGSNWVKSLRTLCLSGMTDSCIAGVGAYTLEELLHQLVSLQSLVMEDYQGELCMVLETIGSCRVTTEATASTESMWPCPNLRSLRFENRSYVRLVQLLACVRSRYGRHKTLSPLTMPSMLPTPLKDLAIQNSFIIDRQLHDAEDMIAEIREIVGDGVFSPQLD